MKQIIDIPDELFSIFKKHGIMAFDYFNEYDKDQIAIAITHGTPYNPSGDSISREAINSEIEKRYCSKHCVVPSEEPYCPDNCPARFLKNIVKECPPVPDRPKGEWINHRNDYGHNIADCSLCGKAMQWHDEDGDGVPRYCWYCGAEMKGGAE